MATPPTAAELLLHPVRLRVVQAFLGDRRMTTSGLREELPDVPPATLYRHVATLVSAGVLAVVDEQRVRGAVERTYSLRVEAAQVGPDDLATMSRDDHRQAFTGYVAGLLAAYERYLRRDRVDLVADRVMYRQTALWLTDEELDALLADLVAAVAARSDNAPAPGRTRRLLATVLMPSD